MTLCCLLGRTPHWLANAADATAHRRRRVGAVDAGTGRLRGSVEQGLWPLVETFLDAHDAAGLAVAVVREEEVVSRGFGVRDVGSGASVTPETIFHLASVSKPFVATAIVSLATARDAGEPVLDLDAPIVAWVPEFTLADGRAGAVSYTHLTLPTTPYV